MATAVVIFASLLCAICPAFAAGDTIPDVSRVLWLRSPAISAEKTAALVFFWEPWCAPCMEAVPHLQKAVGQYDGDLKLIVVSKEAPDAGDAIRAMLPEEWIVCLDTGGIAHSDFRDPVLPHIVLANSGGRILFRGHPAALSVGRLDSLYRGLEPEAIHPPYEPPFYEGVFDEPDVPADRPRSFDMAFARSGVFQAAMRGTLSDTLANLSIRRTDRPGDNHSVNYYMNGWLGAEDSVMVIPYVCALAGKTAARSRVVGKPVFASVELKYAKKNNVRRDHADKFLGTQIRNAFGIGQFDTTETLNVWRIVVTDSTGAKIAPLLDTTSMGRRAERRRTQTEVIDRSHVSGTCISFDDSYIDWCSSGASFADLAEALEKIFGEPVEDGTGIKEQYRLEFKNYARNFADVRKELEAAYGIRFVAVKKKIAVTVFAFPSEKAKGGK